MASSDTSSKTAATLLSGEESTSPILGSLTVIFAVVIVAFPTFFTLRHYFHDWFAANIPFGELPLTLVVLLVLFGVVRMFDVAARGKLSQLFAHTLFWGFPTFRYALDKLPRWYARDPELVQEYIRDHGSAEDLRHKTPFSRWMVATFVPHFENNVEALAYWGAGFLIVVVGLRGTKVLTNNHTGFILLALLLEFFLISLLGFTLFFKPEESNRSGGVVSSGVDATAMKQQIEELTAGLEDLHKEVEGMDLKLSGLLAKIKESKNS